MEIRISDKALYNRQILLDAIAERQSLLISRRVEGRILKLLADLPNFPRKWPIIGDSPLGTIRKVTVDELTLIFTAYMRCILR